MGFRPPRMMKTKPFFAGACGLAIRWRVRLRKRRSFLSITRKVCKLATSFGALKAQWRSAQGKRAASAALGCGGKTLSARSRLHRRKFVGNGRGASPPSKTLARIPGATPHPSICANLRSSADKFGVFGEGLGGRDLRGRLGTSFPDAPNGRYARLLAGSLTPRTLAVQTRQPLPCRRPRRFRSGRIR